MKRLFNLFIIVFILILTGCKQTEKITVSFETNGGNEIGDVVFEDYEDFVLPPEPIKDEHRFVNWFYDVDLFVEFDINIPIERDLTLYAKWEEIELMEYTITFDPLSNDSEVKTITITEGESLGKPSKPKNSDYNFAGWFVDRELTVEYDFNSEIESSFTLYAKWEIPLMEEDDHEVFYIVTSPGEDTSTTININYQAYNTKSTIEYTVASDKDFTNKNTIKPNIYAWEALSPNLGAPFTRRNVCKVIIDNLTPNTEYKYRVNQGNGTYSDEYFFKTSGGDQKTSFVFMTDVHYYHGFDGAEISEEVINSALRIQPDLDFVLTTGDMVDIGGHSGDWDKQFTYSESFKKLPYLGVPGNHELVSIAGTKNQIFRANFNFPTNGYGEYKGSSYYFVHNDTLFIQLDTNASFNVGAQVEWLEEVIVTNPTDFIIIGTHPPFHLTRRQGDYKRFYLDILEKYSVDLVLTGHLHYDELEVLFEDEKPYNEHLGVAYLIGAGGGIKSLGGNDPLDFAKGYIIDVLDDRIVIRYINARGDILSTREVINKKLAPKEEATKEELLSSIEYVQDLENETITFNWSSKFYKNVKEMMITEAYRDQREKTFVFPTPGYVKHQFDKFNPDYDHLYTFEIVFADGSKEIVPFEFNLSSGINLEVEEVTNNSVTIIYDKLEGSEAAAISRYEVLINDEIVSSYRARDVNNNFEHVNSATITDLNNNTEYELAVKVYGHNGFIYSDKVSFKTK